MRLYLIRHGRTQSNVDHLLDTAHPGAPLDETGLAQADALAERLGDEPITGVYSSDLTRAVQTATPLAGRLGLSVTQLPGLREIPAGVEELNADWTAYVQMLGRWGTDPKYKLAGSEDADTFVARYDAAIAEIAATHEVAAAVSHGAAMRVWAPFRAQNMTLPSERGLANTDVIVLEGTPADGWLAISWAGEHLAQQ